MNRETKRLLQRQGQLGPDEGSARSRRVNSARRRAASRAAAGAAGRLAELVQRVAEFLREVRNELREGGVADRAEADQLHDRRVRHRRRADLDGLRARLRVRQARDLPVH